MDESQASLAGGIIYMFQIAGGSTGLGLTITVFAEQSSFIDGLQAPAARRASPPTCPNP